MLKKKVIYQMYQKTNKGQYSYKAFFILFLSCVNPVSEKRLDSETANMWVDIYFRVNKDIVDKRRILSNETREEWYSSHFKQMGRELFLSVPYKVQRELNNMLHDNQYTDEFYDAVVNRYSCFNTWIIDEMRK